MRVERLLALCALLGWNSACHDDAAASLVSQAAVGAGTRLDSSIARAPEQGAGEQVQASSGSPLDTAAAPKPLSAIPAGQPGEPSLIEFTDLSLVGLDVDAIFDPAEDGAGLSQLPESIRALDKKLVAIEGFMIPMEWQGTRVQAFMLVRDMAGCCFGQMPKPDEWIEVVMAEGELADYYPYMPVLTTGTFELSGETDDLGYVTGAYRLLGESVTDEW